MGRQRKNLWITSVNLWVTGGPLPGSVLVGVMRCGRRAGGASEVFLIARTKAGVSLGLSATDNRYSVRGNRRLPTDHVRFSCQWRSMSRKAFLGPLRGGFASPFSIPKTRPRWPANGDNSSSISSSLERRLPSSAHATLWGML